MLPSWNVADWLQVIYLSLTLLGIVVGGYVAVWVVNTLQKELDNDRFLKEHFGKEVVSIRDKYRDLIDNINAGKLTPKVIKTNLSRLSASISMLMPLISSQFGIDRKSLNKGVIDLGRLIEDDDLFSSSYNNNESFKPSDDLSKEIAKLEQENDKQYNELLISIYKQ